MRRISYFVRQAIINIRNNRLVHFIGLSTMVISILILGAFALLYVNVYGWLQNWGGSMRVSVYLRDGLSKGEVAQIEDFIKQQLEIESCRYVSKAMALEDLKQALGPQSKLLSALSTNPLPASFELEVKGLGDPQKQLTRLQEKLEKLPGVEEVQYSQVWIERFKGLLDLVKIIGLVVGGLLAMDALFIVTNTIKLTIYSRKEEIEILKLVGATDWFVKMPFLIEGMIQGVFSAAVALVILFGGYILFSVKKTTFLSLAVLKIQFIPFPYVVAILGLSLVVGVLGSLIAVGRFFEVAKD